MKGEKRCKERRDGRMWVEGGGWKEVGRRRWVEGGGGRRKAWKEMRWQRGHLIVLHFEQ